LKIMIDENLPPALARALSALFKGKHDVIHIRDRFGPGITDTEWMKALNKEGSWIIISGDRRIKKNKAERQVFQSSKLIGFFLASALQRSPITKQMERLMAVWSGIELQAASVAGGSMFVVPIKTTLLKTL